MSKVSKLQSWIEVENIFLNNGKRRRYGSVLPTEAYLFAWECRRTRHGVRRRSRVQTLTFKARGMSNAIRDFLDRPDVVLIREQDRSDYMIFRGEPKILPRGTAK